MYNSTRRDFIKSVGAAVAGSSAASFVDLDQVLLDQDPAPASAPQAGPNTTIGVALIGVGSRGSHLRRSHGYWSVQELARETFKAAPPARIAGVEIRTVADCYKARAEEAQAAIQSLGGNARIETDWRRVMDDKNIDAVVIATADVWHTPIALAAAQAGKDVYVEKCMSNNVKEAKELKSYIKANPARILQVGHQNRHSNYHKIARELIKTGTLGKISSVQATLGRNTSDGAYANKVSSELRERIVGWELFLPPGCKEEFSVDKFLNWRKYWAFSTGMAGDLLSHEIDAVNMLLGVEIPDSVVASGGNYIYKDGRETPDVYSVIHEYKDRELTLTYNGTFGSAYDRKLTICGTDAAMVLGLELAVYPDSGSTRYRKELDAGKMNPASPFIHFAGPTRDPKLKTSPTLAWAEGKGLTFTDIGGKRLDVTRLHLEEFYKNVRERTAPTCGIDDGYKVAIACCMGTLSFRENRRVRYDREKDEVL
ncbi:MAG: Gfo/Idh/MocA family protein [Planctomycetota bacterium]